MKIGITTASTAINSASFEIRSRKNLRLAAYAIVSLADFMALAVGFLVPQLIYLGSLGPSQGVVIFGVLTPIYFGIAVLNRAYAADVLENIAAGISRSLQAFIFAAGSLLLIAYSVKAGAEFSRIIFASGASLTALMLIVNRFIAGRPIFSLLRGSPYTTIVVRDDVEYDCLPGEIVLVSSEIGFDPATQDPYIFHAFAETVSMADRIVIACPATRYALWSSVLKGLAVKGEIISDEQIDIGILSLAWHRDHRTMVVAAGPLALRDRITKRILDLMLSMAGLLTLLPLLIGVAVAIKLESRGPIFFIQKRVGRDNKLFFMFKFRSMYTDQCDANAVTLTTRNDSRVTKIGKFIRKTSIDELPQLFNVLVGDMAIVGPRPHALSAKAADQFYWEVDPRYRHRHSMKPGITGLAQVRGFRGNTERTEDLTNRLQADLEYLEQWSIWRDFDIILQTFFVMRHGNAF